MAFLFNEIYELYPTIFNTYCTYIKNRVNFNILQKICFLSSASFLGSSLASVYSYAYEKNAHYNHR